MKILMAKKTMPRTLVTYPETAPDPEGTPVAAPIGAATVRERFPRPANLTTQ